MKTLQRLHHVRPLADTTAGELREARLRSARRAHRAVWWRWFRRVGLFLLLVSCALGARWWLTQRRVVVDGLVRATRHVSRARFEGRVVQVLCRAGERVERGTPLVRLEPLRGDGGARRLELALDEARLRLDLARQGATPFEVDPLGRDAAQALAAIEAENARAEAEVLASQGAALEREREAISAARDLAEARAAGQVAGLERLERADLAVVEAARAREAGARAAALASTGLAAWDIGPRQAAELDRHRLTELEHETAARSAEADGRATQLATARRAAELEPVERAARLARVRAEGEALARRRAGAERRAELWGELARLRDDGGPVPDPRRVRALELELLAVRVADAEAALTRHSIERGDGLLVAEQDGVVERVLVQVGATVAAGEALVATHDPHSLWIEAYVPDGRLARISAGSDCRVLPRGARLGAAAADGWVRAVGGALVPRPAGLPAHPRAEALDPPWQLPVEVACLPGQGLELRPNQTVKVVLVPRPVSAAGRPAPPATRTGAR